MTSHFSISRGGRFVLDINTKYYEVEEHIATKVKVNPQIISTFKNEKSILIMSPGGIFKTSMVGLLVILVA